ncbi:MAG: M28 family peptidase [Bacteroidetes bacterium]|nr:M28 family peptidase [Bacteroidota bacterium]
MKYFLLFFLSFYSCCYPQIQFSTDSSLSYLKTVSVEIGARPMGSMNEHRALKFGLNKFREFGLDDAYLMKMDAALNDHTGALANTSSGIAVGVLKGTTDRIIIIGAHIDSASPFVPGANDNGSGSAVVIELARVLSREQFRHTIVFCLFGGEEAGLHGSNFFVNNFAQIDKVDLMLGADMADGGGPLHILIDTEYGSAPIWLVQSAYEEFNKLGYSGLCYTTHFFAAMNIIPGSIISSDHEPFMSRGIPAITFTSDLNDPIHTPQDDFAHFEPGGLKRSGDLINNLVHRFDNNIGNAKTNDYYLLQAGNRALFFPLWLLCTFILISIALSIAALLIARKRRFEIDRNRKTRIPALKLFLIALLIQACVWLSENLFGLIKGVRFPFPANPDLYILLGFLAALVGIAISLKLTPRMNLSKDPYRWYFRAVAFLLILILLAALSDVRVAFYPAVSLFLLTLAIIAKIPWLKLLFWILSPHFMFRLFFSEGFSFLSRQSAYSFVPPIWVFLMHIFYIIFFSLWSFPFLLGFAAVYFDTKVNFLWLNKWKTRLGISVISAAFIICAAVLLFIPSYSDEWRQTIYFDENVDMKTENGILRLMSSEFLRDIYIDMPEKDTVITTRERDIVFGEFSYEGTPWIQLNRKVTAGGDSSTVFDISLKPRFTNTPSSFTITYSSSVNKMEEISGNYITNKSYNAVSLKWNYPQDTTLTVLIHFKVINADSVTESIDARFIELIHPVRIEKEMTNINSQTIIRQSEIIKR